MKHIKMVLYGEPGVGKSVFASKAPKPFFITTDGNYEFLEDFGAKPEDHIQVNSWTEAKKALSNTYDNYDTIVIDLAEDLFKWCEYEFCKKNGYEHVSDLGFGKGYDITRNDFFINICKILNLPKNVILIMHGITNVVKDRRGIEHTKYMPTNRLPDKVLDMVEGRVKYFLRAYVKAEEINGKLVKKRYLSLVPKENEYGILRGIDENTIPSDIPLDFNTFAQTIGLEVKDTKPQIVDIKIAQGEHKVELNTEPVIKLKSEPVEVTNAETKSDFKTAEIQLEPVKKVRRTKVIKEEKVDIPMDITKAPGEEDIPWEKEEVKPEVKEEVIQEPVQEPVKEAVQEPVREKTRAEKIAEIQARLAAMQNRR